MTKYFWSTHKPSNFFQIPSCALVNVTVYHLAYYHTALTSGRYIKIIIRESFSTAMSFLLRTSRFIASSGSRPVTQFSTRYINFRAFTTSRTMAAVVDSHFVNQITAAEKEITNSDEPAKGGPTAAAQSHVGQELTAQVVHDITMGERAITGKAGPVKGGPTSVAQKVLTGNFDASNATSNTTSGSEEHSGRLDSKTIHKITEKEKQLTGDERPVQDGPTAKAQQHAGEPITSQALHDITEGEKKITGGERVKGGPTSAAQSELGKSRS
ncbi:hypothetical protein CC86DRAFT_371475 [Ophiobolus disseminans]|uniref:SMP domain-containing protein n=1 Tax=Ophiobolus disseminans TaxID=1469910 RepID=A0A6A6ZWS8_9PLEO|nr:hypothetical protein CC86DRAFT_371475 [Ophiobolus disseminans]